MSWICTEDDSELVPWKTVEELLNTRNTENSSWKNYTQNKRNGKNRKEISNIFVKQQIDEKDLLFRSPLKVLKNAIDSPDSENVIIAFLNLQDHFALTKGKQSLIIDAMQES